MPEAFVGFEGRGGAAPHIVIPPARNRHGHDGSVCKGCDGWGYVLQFRGGGPCAKCGGSGVARRLKDMPHVRELLDLFALEEARKLGNPGLSDAEKLQRLLDIQASRQYWSEQIWWATASGSAVSNTVTETIIFPNITVPANYLNDGRTLTIVAQGQYGTHSSGAVTDIFRLRWGGVSGTIICQTDAITLAVSLTTVFWELKVTIQTRSNGSTGTVMGNGVVMMFGATGPTLASATGAPAVAAMTAGGQDVPAVATLDLTADTALSISIQHGAAQTANTLTGLNYCGVSEN